MGYAVGPHDLDCYPGRAHPGWTKEAIPGPDPVVWGWIAPLLPFADEKEELPGHFLKGGGGEPTTKRHDEL